MKKNKKSVAKKKAKKSAKKSIKKAAGKKAKRPLKKANPKHAKKASSKKVRKKEKIDKKAAKKLIKSEKTVLLTKPIKKKALFAPKSPSENSNQPYNIFESYMGSYRFNDMFSVLFVCTGNICRSPMAEGLFRRKMMIEAPENLREKMWVESCGIYAYDGNKPSENSVKVCAKNGVDIANHRSKAINRVLIEQSDLIFAMSIDHLNFIQENFPGARHKSYLFKVFGKDRAVTIADSVPDPMGFSMDFYVKTFADINTTIDQSFQKIISMAEQKISQKPL